jgi:hypothetical protein
MKPDRAITLFTELDERLQKRDEGGPGYFGHEIEGLLGLVDRVIETSDEQDMNQTERLVGASVSIFGSLVSEPETWRQLPKVSLGLE